LANLDAAFGLIPIRHMNGNPWNGVTTRCLVEDNYGTALFIGDPVIVTGVVGSDDTTGVGPVVNIASAGDTNRISGVVTSIQPIPTNLAVNYMPASTGGYVNVCMDPDVVFIVQDDAGATLTSAVISDNAVLASGTGSTVTGRSAWELAAATAPASDASYQLLILSVHDVPDNAVGANCIWEVLISNHTMRGGGAAADEGVLGI